MDLIRVSTAGSVDDGKSTLIGRLLYDNNSLTVEQEELVRKKTLEKGLKDLDFSVITDGLIAEREQGITIDVAHIYFSTKQRKFIIADSPGHVEYTRNMVTGASNAQTSIILIDARKGLLEQSYRHFFISHLLQIKTVIFCINKMDLVDYQQEIFDNISNQISSLLKQYKGLPHIEIVPVSSLKGDNVVFKSEPMNWYTGQTLNEILHQIPSEEKENENTPFRMDVQNVLHVQNDQFVDYRGYSGRVSSGKISVGDTIVALPSSKEAKVTELRAYQDTLDTAVVDQSINLSIDTEIDISRGAIMIKKGETPPIEDKKIKAKMVWLDETVGRMNDKYILKGGVKKVLSKISHIYHEISPENPQKTFKTQEIKLNSITEIELSLSAPVFMDKYLENKNNGAFILINTTTNNTCAVGFIE